MRGNRNFKLFKNWQIKIVCLLLAIVVYVLFTYNLQEKRVISLPLVVELPSDYHATSIIPDTVNVVIKGTEDRIYMLDISDITAKADFTKVRREGVSSVPVELDLTSFNNGINIEQVTIYSEPASVKVYFEK